MNKLVFPIQAASAGMIGIYQVNFDPSTELHSDFNKVPAGTIVVQTGSLDANCDYTCGPKMWIRGCGDCNNQNWHEVTIGLAVP